VTADSDNKFFIAFERVDSDGTTGVCFHEFDKNSRASPADDQILMNADMTFPNNRYGGGRVQRIWLYANKLGNKVTITIVTKPDQGKVTMLTASKDEGGSFIKCDSGDSLPQFETLEIEYLAGFYYHDGSKNKFFAYKNSQNEHCGGVQDH
jgi:hypothetical protein